MKYFNTILLFFLPLFLQAQVTIGLTEAPNEGALLDLKEFKVSGGGANSTKGLMLPLVKLGERSTLLLADQTEALEHVGLIVYNVSTNESSESRRICPGLHVWNGKEWLSLVPYPKFPDLHAVLKEKYPPKTYKDIRKKNGVVVEEEVYNTAWFGTFKYKGGTDISEYSQYSCDPDQEIPELGDGRYWFTQNLRTKYTPDGNPLSLVTTGSRRQDMIYGYPHPKISTNPEHYENNRHYGLLYNWYALINNENPLGSFDNADQSFPNDGTLITHSGESVEVKAGDLDPFQIPVQPYEIESVYESEPGKKDGFLVGICPDGWHVPSQREWYEILYHMTVGGQLYANVYSDKELSKEEKKNTAWFMAASEDIEGSEADPVSDDKNFMSKPSNDNGYYALLTGWGVHNGIETRGYGVNTWIWSSSSSAPHSSGDPGARDFYFNIGDAKLVQFNDRKEYLLPTRCVENTRDPFVLEDTGSENLDLNTGLGTITDRDGITYTVAKFGDSWWMTQNLATKSLFYPKAGKVSLLEYSTTINENDKWGMPIYLNVKNSQGHEVVEDGAGLLYNWAAATGRKGGYTGVGSATPEGAGEASQEDIGVKGICPEGWHLPSDVEWNKLEQEINDNPSKYADGFGTAPAKWVQSNNTSTYWRGEHSSILQSKFDYTPTKGFSKHGSEGGFDFKHLGYGNYTNGLTVRFADATYYWTSSSYSLSSKGWARRMDDIAQKGIDRYGDDRRFLFSVRCIRD